VERPSAEGAPLGHVRLAEQERAGLPEPRDHARVASNLRSDERERTGGRLHPVRGRDAVLHHDRDPVERPADPAGHALGIEGASLRLGIRIHLDHRVEPQALPVEPLDPLEVGARERERGELPAIHRGLQLSDRDVVRW